MTVTNEELDDLHFRWSMRHDRVSKREMLEVIADLRAARAEVDALTMIGKAQKEEIEGLWGKVPFLTLKGGAAPPQTS